MAEVVGVRDSKDPAGPVLPFSPYSWASFTTGLRDGRRDGDRRELGR